MGRLIVGALVLLYAFGVGHFNLFIGLASGLVIWKIYERHEDPDAEFTRLEDLFGD